MKDKGLRLQSFQPPNLKSRNPPHSLKPNICKDAQQAPGYRISPCSHSVICAVERPPGGFLGFLGVHRHQTPPDTRSCSRRHWKLSEESDSFLQVDCSLFPASAGPVCLPGNCMCLINPTDELFGSAGGPLGVSSAWCQGMRAGGEQLAPRCPLQ